MSTLIDRLATLQSKEGQCTFAAALSRKYSPQEVEAVEAALKVNYKGTSDILLADGLDEASYYPVRSHGAKNCACFRNQKAKTV